MDKYEREAVQDAIMSDDFTYAFVSYSSFESIEDEQFHKLRREFLAAYQALHAYVYKKGLK